MSEFSNQVKAAADIVRVVGEHVALRKAGSSWAGLCPFHAEKSASFHVHPAKQFYYCFGCQAHGDVFQFLMQLQKLSFPEAVAAVATLHGIAVPQFEPEEQSGERAALLDLHARAAEFFMQQLAGPGGAAARSYLAGRGVEGSAATRFQIGYAPDSGRALTLFLRSQRLSPALAVTAGLCQARRESAGKGEESEGGSSGPLAWDDLYDRFRGRVVFPINNENGKPIAFGARLLATDPSRPAPKYLNSPETPIYTKGKVLYNLDRARDAIRKLDYFILVEGYLDCMSVFLAGFENVVASCGTALTAAQIGLVTRMARKTVVNFDPDAAGANAAERSIALLLEEGFAIRILSLADGLDPDLFLRQRGAEAYREALGKSRSYFDFLTDRVRGRYDVRRAEGKLAALTDLLPYVARIPDPIARAEMGDNLADQLGIEDQIIRQKVRRSVRDRKATLPVSSGAEASFMHSEQLVLRAWVEWDEHRPALTELLRDEHLLEGLASVPLFEELVAAEAEHGSRFLPMSDQLSESGRAQLAQIVMGDFTPLVEGEVAGAIETLRDWQLSRRRKQVARELQEAAHRKDKVRVQELLVLRTELDREQDARVRASRSSER